MNAICLELRNWRSGMTRGREKDKKDVGREAWEMKKRKGKRERERACIPKLLVLLA
jgi:hypothetical protein